ncbi:uncharacterized protein LOC114296032 [Camellia sinensis]|uniref:uncharacterized protein LOC114296032 n=1 Tax=Camellia sinensis TaxID=4442 RepID=UPI001035A78C|nr:uncharacterized protein LOC114296032 [Camellia sinensis]
MEAPKQTKGEDTDRQLVAAKMPGSKKTTKELWESLKLKYKTEDADAKKFVIERFLDFKMLDSKTVVGQVQDNHLIIHDIISEGMILSESFQVAAIIEKLSPAWKDFKIYLKHKCKEKKLEEFIMRLRIEEDNRKSEKKSGNQVIQAKANVMEQGQSSRFNNKKRKHDGKGSKQGLKGIKLSAVVYEANLVGNPKEWWVDTGATRHICADRQMFTTYKVVENGDQLFMGNSCTSTIEGQGKIVLKMTSGKEGTLNNVLHVPEICKNLISESLLIKNGFRLVFEYEKVVLTKAGILEHINYGFFHRLVNLECLSKFNLDLNHKCEMDVKTAFLNGDLNEEIYMEQLERFKVPSQEKKNTNKGYVIICLYVDDTLIIGSNIKMIKTTKKLLKKRFDMKDMGVAEVILGMKISKTFDGYALSQSHSVEKILGKFGKHDNRPAKTPIDANAHLLNNTGESISQVEYSQIIGSLMYLMNCTRLHSLCSQQIK